MELVKLLPMHPQMTDEELGQWLSKHGGRGREVLAYRRTLVKDPLTGEKKAMAECSCTACGGRWLTTYFPPMMGHKYPSFESHDGIRGNGEFTACPECGKVVSIAYYTRLKKYPIISKHYPWEILSRDGCIIFLCWYVEYVVDDTGAYIATEPRNAYVLDTAGKWRRFTAMERSGWSMASKMEYIGTWYERPKFDVADGGWEYILPHGPGVFEGTLLENAKVEKLEALGAGADLLSYARIYRHHPNFENVAMQTPELAAAAVRSTTSAKGPWWVDWKKTKPHEMLRMDKQEYKAAVGCSVEESIAIATKQEAVAVCLDMGIPRSYAPKMGRAGIEFARIYKDDPFVSRWGFRTVWNYVCSTMRGTTANLDTALRLCRDYWRDMDKAGFDTESPAAVFPKDIREAQARATTAINYQKCEKLKEEFTKWAEKLAPLAWAADGLTIRVAATEMELIQEGKALSHCVGGYGATHCGGNCIFFIRHVSAPDVPFFTLQLNTKTGEVIQNHGLKNIGPDKAVKDFVNRWLSEIVKPWERKQKKQKAAQVAA